jgi:NADPH-dependent 2,4-dienoyl-CoA reductase/sulfur reductase-like enzyme
VDWKNLLTGETGTEPYDKLLIATGAVPVRPPVPGIGARGVFGVNTLDSGLAVRRWIEERRPRRAVVVGGGYIGLEMAEAMNCHLGLETSVIERAPQVMGTLDPDMGRMVGEALREVGMSLYLEEGLTAIQTEGDRAVAVETDRRTLEADIVLLGLGVAPNSGLAREAGLPLGVRDAIVVDEGMRTPVEGIYAAGDCVQIRNLASGRPFHVALGTTANKMGRVAGINLAGGEATFPGALGTAVCKICRYEVARTGLLEREMGDLGIDWVAASAESETRAGYYPGAGSITVKLLAERGTGRLLGGQIVGVEGAAKRIDILAAALTARMTVDQLVDLDLSYAPPFSPVWDPVQTAARVLQSRMRKR